MHEMMQNLNINQINIKKQIKYKSNINKQKIKWKSNRTHRNQSEIIQKSKKTHRNQIEIKLKSNRNA